MPPDLTVTAALAPTPVGGPDTPPVGEQVVGEGLVVGHHVEERVDVVAGLGNVDGDGDWGGHVPHGTLLPWPASTPANGSSTRPSTTSPQRGITDLVAAGAGGRDRLQPPDADPPLRRPRGPAGRGRPGRRATPARPARRRSSPTPRPPPATRCAPGGSTSPTRRLWPNERLFFEIYGQALQGRPGTDGAARRDHRRLAGAVGDDLHPARLPGRHGGRAPRHRRDPRPACSTCSPPATTTRSTRRWRCTSPRWRR